MEALKRGAEHQSEKVLVKESAKAVDDNINVDSLMIMTPWINGVEKPE